MLSILGKIYGNVMNVRNRLYDKDVLDSFDLGAITISVGNITTGGTGKTPMVAYIANLLAERGETVCILTRGYGRREPKKRVLVSDGNEIFASAVDAGDEPFELATKLLGKAIVIADADRVSAGEFAKRAFGVTRFLLDDGFQHRRVKRDVDIVCIDATNPFGGGSTLPKGRLREPLTNLERADAIVITRSDLIPEDRLGELRKEIFDLAPNAKIFSGINKILLPESVAHGRAFAFCGIGNPTGFFDQLKRNGVELVGTQIFKDHHLYTQSDAEAIENEASGANAEILLTTAKDAVKLSGIEFEFPFSVVEIELNIENADQFEKLI